ncbi:unnamed protein product [marine sediment metagenome]|uniref:Uncharacterized protein n=1 Tax=marine sediment metagenome TaxID=412755 RepID=X1SNZ5_9ZZZZ
MTIAIGINAGLYTILAADTRTTYFLRDSPFHDDDSSKVHKTTMGLITGAGFCPLLDFVNNRLATETIENTNSMLLVIKQARKQIRKRWQHYALIDSAIEQTGWIFSYFSPIDDKLTLRLGAYHQSLSMDNYVLYGVGDPAIIYPSELSHEEVDDIHPNILSRIVIPNNQSEIQSSIQHNATIIAALILALSPRCRSISNRFQIGIHMNGQRGVSKITDIQIDGKFELNITFDNS